MNRLVMAAGVVFAMIAAGCSGSSSSAPSAATPTSAAGTCAAPVVTKCPTSAGLTSISQITITAGGDPSCRVALHEAIPVSFTIANPDPAKSWQIATNNHVSASPSTGGAGTAGPMQTTVQFTSFGGDNVTNDTLTILVGANGVFTSGGCSAPIYGHN